MAKADVVTLANVLSDSISDTTILGLYYDDVVDEIARGVILPDGMHSLTGATYLLAEATVFQYALPTSGVRFLGVFYDTHQLAEDDPKSVEQVETHWYGLAYRGEPAVYVRVDEDQKTVAIVPAPDRDGEALGVLTPTTGFPADNVMMFYTEVRTDVHTDEELAVALEILARELARDSDHQDADTSKLASQIATLLFTLSHPEPKVG